MRLRSHWSAFLLSPTSSRAPTWDDEGYFLQAFRDFISGRPLYDQVFSLYGPLAFFCAAVLSGFDAGNITHDHLRWALLLLWMAIAGLLAGVVWRYTRQFQLSLRLSC